MIEFTFDFGPLHLRFAVAEPEPAEDDGMAAASGGGVYSTHERVDYPLDPEVDTIGFRANKENR